MRIDKCLIPCCVTAIAAATAVEPVSATEVDSLLSPVPTPVVGEWYKTSVVGNATGELVDLTGLGGNLESAQPTPANGVLKLTTADDVNDKVEIATFDDYGLASSTLNSIGLSFSYYKETVPGGNAFAAPALRIAIFNPSGTGSGIDDSYGQLVYEPYWNQPGGGAPAAPADAWQTVSIDPDTGNGFGDASGGWWWTGGFGIANAAGGPPLRSLAEWEDAFVAAADPDFADARVVGFSFGLGSYNLDNIGYVDDFAITGTDANATYDFVIPEPTSLTLLAIGGLTMLRRRR